MKQIQARCYSNQNIKWLNNEKDNYCKINVFFLDFNLTLFIISNGYIIYLYSTINHQQQQWHIVSLGHSIAPCPCFIALRHMSAGEKPRNLGRFAPTSCCAGIQIYAFIEHVMANPVMHWHSSAQLVLPKQPQTNKQYGQTVHISVTWNVITVMYKRETLVFLFSN